MSTQYRMNRLFGADGRCFDVAMDHGFFNEGPFLSGIEDMARAVETVVLAAPDAVQLTLGQARHLQAIAGPRKPALVLRSDVANVYGHELPSVLFSHAVEGIVEAALRLDAACVVVNLFQIPHRPEVHAQCVQNISRLKAHTEPYGLPLMIEPLVFRPNDEAGGYMVDGDVQKIVPLVRQSAELGADIIKADPTDRLEEYHRVIQAASGRPVLTRGGGRVDDRQLLERTRQLIEQGAAGIVYGRNVIQHANPRAIIGALMRIVHENAGVAELLPTL